jgi:hypothetical protein
LRKTACQRGENRDPLQFRREKTVREGMEKARQLVEELSDPDDEQKQSRQQAAQRRAKQQRAAVLEQALAELCNGPRSFPWIFSRYFLAIVNLV